ncbi:uncharacterized protein [Dermacentor andersoni]|uniref:uncharacterized protein n=1 Tax=Dermacentor andersoni TaxID=34620 RepID=UPI0024176963|nr:uncharacterized protein LOC129388352 [Dermacentor andersoni]
MGTLPPGLVRGRDYSYGHTVEESIAVLREVEKLNLSIPVAISFGMKGMYYAPKFADPSSPKAEEFVLFKPCQDFASAKFDDPKEVCRKSGWEVPKNLPTYAHNLAEKMTITYLTEATIATLVCDAKDFNLKLNYGLAAYDIDYDVRQTCLAFGFATSLGRPSQLNRVLNMRQVMDFLRTNYTSSKDNFNCLAVSDPLNSLIGP